MQTTVFEPWKWLNYVKYNLLQSDVLVSKLCIITHITVNLNFYIYGTLFGKPDSWVWNKEFELNWIEDIRCKSTPELSKINLFEHFILVEILVIGG